MRTIFTLAFIFITSLVFSQDSTEAKLIKYKKLFDTHLIDSGEYSQLKAKLLAIEPTPKYVILNKSNPDSAEVADFKDKAKSRTLAGAILTGAGLGFMIGDIVYSVKTPFPMPGTYTNGHYVANEHYAEETKIRVVTQVVLGVFGGAFTVIGGGLLGSGQHNQVLYDKYKKQLALNYTSDSIGLAYTF